MATDSDGSYIVPADREGNINLKAIDLLHEYVAFRNSVVATFGPCWCSRCNGKAAW